RHPGRGLAGARAGAPALLAAVSLCNCSPQPRSPRLEDSLTSGRITIACTAEARSLIDREVASFAKLYPDAHFRVQERSSAGAIRALFAAQCDLAAVGRDLTPEERGAAARAGLEIEGYRFARDATVAVVHSSNPVENAALPELSDIYEGKVTNWRGRGGPPGSIEPVIPGVETDVTNTFIQQALGRRPIRAAVVYEDTDSGVVAA